MSKIPSSISKSPSSNTYWAVAILNYKPKDYDELCLTSGQAIQVSSVIILFDALEVYIYY